MIIIISLCLFLWVVYDIYKKYKIKKKYGSLEAQYKSWFEKEKEDINKQLEEKRVELQSQEKQIDTIIQKEKELIQEKLDKFKNLGYNKINIEIQDFKNKKEQEILEQINNLSSQKQQEINDLFWKSNLEYQEQKEKLRLDLLHQKEENLKYINNLLENKQTLISEIEDYKQKRKAINEAIRREEEVENEIDYHRIILSDMDKEDINYLLSIEEKIHNKDLLHKLIWSEYLQKPFNQMINNIFGSNVPKNVIYCIENYTTHKKYIGKTSAEVSKRWTEHIKSSLNIGGIKKQKIHEALFKHWDEYTFSILEVVTKETLNEKEKYYISFFETDKYGFNSKSGG